MPYKVRQEWLSDTKTREERKKELGGYIKDFDIVEADFQVIFIQSTLSVVQGAINKAMENPEEIDLGISNEDYWFTIQGIKNQIDELWKMIQGFDQFVTDEQLGLIPEKGVEHEQHTAS